MISTVSPNTSMWASRPAADAREGRKVDTSGPTTPTPAFDAFDAADAEFDFEAADKAAAATLVRDQQQMKLAEMADARTQGSVSAQAVIAAYREFED